MNLLNKIKEKNIKVCVIGLGYVGLPIFLELLSKKINVVGLDINKNKISLIKKLDKNVSGINLKKIKKIFQNKHELSNDFLKIKVCDIIIICVPTPLKENKKPELKYIKDVINSMTPYLKENQLISLESTSYPGTTKSEIINKLKKIKRFDIGKNFYVCYSPERINPGSNLNPFKVPKVLSGYSDSCKKFGKAFYELIFRKIYITSSLETAEFTKLLENIYRSVNIALVNELKIVADKLNLNIHECIKAASTKPFGYRPFLPGPGFGGHCIPIDPFYLSYISNLHGYNPKFITHAGYINRYMPKWICSKLIKNLKNKKRTKKILIVGVSYKKNVDDMRESPALEVSKILLKKNYSVYYHDPMVPTLTYEYLNYFINSKSLVLKEGLIKSFDAVIIITDHDIINFSILKKYSKLIIDSRNVYKLKNTTNVISA